MRGLPALATILPLLAGCGGSPPAGVAGEGAAAYYVAADLRRAAGDPEEALELVEKALELEPGRAGYHLLRGEVLALAGRSDEAIAALRRAVEIDADDFWLQRRLAAAYESRGRLPEADARLRRAIDLEPADIGARVQLGELLLQLGRPAEAIETQRGALALNPDHPLAGMKLGEALAAAGRYQEAARVYARLLAITPGEAELHFRIAGLRLAQGRDADAAASFARALELRPTEAKYLRDTAWFRLRSGRLDEARGLAERLEWVDEQSEESLHLFAALALAESRPERAQKLLVRALEMNPGNPRYMKDLARALEARARTRRRGSCAVRRPSWIDEKSSFRVCDDGRAAGLRGAGGARDRRRARPPAGAGGSLRRLLRHAPGLRGDRAGADADQSAQARFLPAAVLRDAETRRPLSRVLPGRLGHLRLRPSGVGGR